MGDLLGNELWYYALALPDVAEPDGLGDLASRRLDGDPRAHAGRLLHRLEARSELVDRWRKDT